MCFWKAHQERAVSEGLKKNGALAGGMAQLQLALLKRRVRFTQGGRCSDGVGVVRRSRERSREREKAYALSNHEGGNEGPICLHGFLGQLKVHTLIVAHL